MPKQIDDSAKIKLTPTSTETVDVDPKAPRGRPKGHGLDEVLALRKRGFSLAEIAKQRGCSKQAISQMLTRSGVDVEVVEQFKKDKPFILHAKQKMVLDSITLPVINKMSGRDRFIATGILADKIRDLEGGVLGGITANLWVNLVSQSHKLAEKDITPPVDAVAEEVAE